MSLNRVEALAGIIVSLALAVVPVITNMDWTSTAGIVAGIAAVLGIVSQRLKGWQVYDSNQTAERVATLNAFSAGQQVTGATQGVKAAGFQPEDIPPPGI